MTSPVSVICNFVSKRSNKMATKPATKSMPISAKTGRIVTPGYAKTHPATTVVLKVPVVAPGKAKK